MSRILSIFLLSSLLAGATPIKFGWDPNPSKDQVIEYTLYRLDTTDTTDPDAEPSWIEVGSTAETELGVDADLSVETTWALTASNLAGESPRSESLVVPPIPLAPPGQPVTSRIVEITIDGVAIKITIP